MEKLLNQTHHTELLRLGDQTCGGRHVLFSFVFWYWIPVSRQLWAIVWKMPPHIVRVWALCVVTLRGTSAYADLLFLNCGDGVYCLHLFWCRPDLHFWLLKPIAHYLFHSELYRIMHFQDCSKTINLLLTEMLKKYLGNSTAWAPSFIWISVPVWPGNLHCGCLYPQSVSRAGGRQHGL